MKVTLKAIDETNTLLTTKIEYTKFIGLFPKILAMVFPGMFRKQVQKWLEKFKVFAENQ